jgi:FkbM family methyltransferase
MLRRILPERVRAAFMRMLWRISEALQHFLEDDPSAGPAEHDWDRWGFMSYSQEGEDMVLWFLCRYQREGFYVDVGAHHPVRLSNTCHFHCLGWRGINIDADPNAIEAFRRARPNDVNINVGVAGEPGELKFFRYHEPSFNTFEEELVKERAKTGFGGDIAEVSRVKVLPLSQILHEHLEPRQQIDLMTVDVEGMDLEVLRSNDWEDFRPKFILVECYGVDLAGIQEDATVKFLNGLGYSGVAKTENTAILRDLA